MVRIGRVLLLLILLAGAVLAAWYAGRPAVREFRVAQRLHDDLPDVGMIAENAELLLADPPVDLPHTLGSMLTPLFDADESLAAVRLRDTNGTLLCEVDRDAPQEPREHTALPDIPAPSPPSRLTGARLDNIYQLQQILNDQSDLSEHMDAALRAEKSAGQHSGLYVLQDNNQRVAELLSKRVPRLRAATRDMDDALDALTHTDTDSLNKALRASQDAEAGVSLALEDLRAVTDFPGRLPAAFAAAAEDGDLLPLRARRVTAPLYVPTGDETLLAPAGAAEVIFYDRPTDVPRAVAHRVLASPLRWIPSAVLLLAALLALIPRRQRRS